MGSGLLLASLLLASPLVARQSGVPIGTGKELATVSITSPSGGWSVDRMLLVEGTVSDTTVDPIVVSMNGDRYFLRTFGGKFSRKFPASPGKNVVIVSATNLAGTARAQVTTWSEIPPVPLRAVLTSDTDGVYTDLHIYEPAPVGSESPFAHVFWARTESPSGGTFFLNEQGGDYDQPGYGPYLYIHRAPPAGLYLIATNYWPSGDKAHTEACLNLTLFEGTANEMRRRVLIPLATPGTTLPLAWINVLSADRALVWIPSNEPRPANPDWPAGFDSAPWVKTIGGYD